MYWCSYRREGVFVGVGVGVQQDAQTLSEKVKCEELMVSRSLFSTPVLSHPGSSANSLSSLSAHILDCPHWNCVSMFVPQKKLLVHTLINEQDLFFFLF